MTPLFSLLFLSLFFAPPLQTQEEKPALPKGYREVGPDKGESQKGAFCFSE
jgi:hypothetical protein